MKTILSIIFIALLLSGCSKDDDNASSDFNPKKELRINNLREGQYGRFLSFNYHCHPDSTFRYTGDTLELRVVRQGAGLAFRESYTPGSAHNAGFLPITYPVIQGNGYFLIPQRDQSQLFFFFGNDTVPVMKPVSTQLQQGDCFIEYASGGPFIGEEVGRLPQFHMGDILHTEKRVVSCVPPFMNLDAYLVYDNEQLHVSMTISDGFSSLPVWGFALIPNE